MKYAFIIAAIASIWIMIGIDPNSQFGSIANQLLSNRITLTQQAFHRFGLTFFGQDITWITASSIRSGAYYSAQYLYIDNSYLNILINYGIATFAFLLAGLTLACRSAVSKSDWIAGAGFIVFAVHSIVDPQMADLNYCFFLLYLSHELASASSSFARNAKWVGTGFEKQK